MSTTFIKKKKTEKKKKESRRQKTEQSFYLETTGRSLLANNAFATRNAMESGRGAWSLTGRKQEALEPFAHSRAIKHSVGQR